MNLGDIKDAVYARGFEDDQEARIVIFANNVQRDVLGEHRWDFMVESATVAAVVGTASYALPAGVHHVESIRLLQPGQPYIELEHAAADDLLEWEAYAASSTAPYVDPADWRWSSTLPDTFRILPAPTLAGTFTVRYIGLPDAMVDDADEPTIPAPYHDIIVVGVCELLSKRTRQWDAADRFRAELVERKGAMAGQLGMKQRQTAVRVAHAPRRD